MLSSSSTASLLRSLILVSAAIAAFITVPLAGAQLPKPLAQPDVALLASGTVNAIARQPDGSIVLAGYFKSINGEVRRNIARRLPNGTLDASWHPSVDGYVLALAVDATGATYVGGEFTSVNGQARRNLVKISPAGEVVPDWNPSPDRLVSVITLGTDGDVFIGGQFQTIGGLRRDSLAKISATTGAVDAIWNPSNGASFVSAIELSHDGAVYVAGSIGTMGGQVRRGVAKLATDGTGVVDPEWNPSPDGNVTDLAVAPDGSVFIAGEFWRVGVGANTVYYSNVVKLEGSGVGRPVSQWNPFSSLPLGWARRVAVDDSGNVYVGSGMYLIANDEVLSLFKVSADGAGEQDLAWRPAPHGTIGAILVGDGKVFAGGSFNELNGQPRFGFAALGGNGADNSPVFDVESPVQAYVRAVAVQPDGRLVVSGEFRKANGQYRRGLLRLNADGSLDMDWNPRVNYRVFAIAIGSDGSVFLGGGFSLVNGIPRSRLAKLSSENGALDMKWNPPVLYGYVNALAIDSKDNIYVGGAFATAASSNANLIRVSESGTGDIDKSWVPCRPCSETFGLVLDGDSALFVVSNYNNFPTARRDFARYLTSSPGTVDPEWTLPSVTGIRDVGRDGAGSIYVGGWFSAIGGLPQQRLAKLSARSGVVDASWSRKGQNDVYKIAVSGNGDVYAVDAEYIGPDTVNSLRKYSAEGSGGADQQWMPSINGNLRYMTAASDVLLIGGGFTEIGGETRFGLAALPLDVPDAVYANGFDASPVAVQASASINGR